MKKTVVVRDRLQNGYRYTLEAPMGKDFDPRFKPELTPKQMLSLGVFGGTYLQDNMKEFPADWFAKAKMLPSRTDEPDAFLNFFKVNASQPLSVWQAKGWINAQDPLGWFQWYCRYYMGRRSPDDERQIKRWIAIRRHIAQIRNKCSPGNYSCNTRQRQAVLHWAYDSRKI